MTATTLTTTNKAGETAPKKARHIPLAPSTALLTRFDAHTLLQDGIMSDDTMSEPEPASGTAENSATKERSVDPASWPLRNVKEPHDNDVLYGRGGGTNHHPGVRA